MDEISLVVTLHEGIIVGYSAFWKEEDAFANAKQVIPDDELNTEFSNEYYRCTDNWEWEVYIECVNIQ